VAKGSPGDTPQGLEGDSRDLPTVFGEQLRAARLKAGLSQAGLGERLGLSQQYISSVEAGRENLTLATMLALARAIGHDLIVEMRRARRPRKQ
jgi:transcriptional regulator with XRE-family HTH domain